MKRSLTHVQVIALGYLLIITVGTVLLMLPFASADGISAGFLDAFFTSTSASCVTGLILRDTATGWSLFGQIVIIVLIQIGGLGFMTIATFLYLILNKRMGLRQREIMVESINVTQIGGIMKLARHIVKGTLIFELSGALLMSVRFIPMFGFAKGLWYGVFHSISAFCNAGFDLMGAIQPFSSFTSRYDDWFINVVMMILITVGGLGFLVWDDLNKFGFKWKKYRFHTKLVLVTSAILTFGGAAVIFLLEGKSTGADLGFGDRVLTALFASVTARTAGFNTVDVGAMSGGGKLLTMVLMFIGGSPGSTAGGVKTTTIACLVLYSFGNLFGQKKPVAFGRSISADTLKKSSNICVLNLSLALTASILISHFQTFDLSDVVFECMSAIGTVGMTAGITQSLVPASAVVIAVLMMLGRVGSVTFAVAILNRRANDAIRYPEEEIIVG